MHVCMHVYMYMHACMHVYACMCIYVYMFEYKMAGDQVCGTISSESRGSVFFGPGDSVRRSAAAVAGPGLGSGSGVRSAPLSMIRFLSF